MIQSNAPLSNVESNLSADGIAQLLGYANAAAMVAATEAGELTTPATTGGTNTAYTLTDSRVGTPTNGQIFAFLVHAASGSNPTLAVNGSAARNLAYLNAAGTYSLFSSPGMLTTETALLVRYNSSGPRYVVLSQFCMVATSIPATLNATTFAGAITLPADGRINGHVSNAGYAIVSGGSSSSPAHGSSAIFYGNSHSSKPGDAEYYCGSASGAAHSFFDKNGAGKLAVNEYGLLLDSIGGYTGQRIAIGPVSAADYGGNGAAQTLLHSSTHATYPGAHQQFAPLSTRASSTAFAVCPVATGDTARVELQDDAAGTTNCVASVDSAGTVTFLTGSDAKYVNSSSPGAAEIGVYISAGVLYAKPGSGLTVKIASFSRIGKA